MHITDINQYVVHFTAKTGLTAQISVPRSMPLLLYARFTTTIKDSRADRGKQFLGRMAHCVHNLRPTSEGAVQENLGLTFSGTPAMEDKKRIAIDFVNRIHAGDRLAEGELVQHYGPGVLLMLKQRIQDQQLAVDLSQDTFVIVIERLRGKSLNEPHKLGAFIYGTSKNLLIGDLRKKARRKTFADSDIVAETADSDSGPFENVSRDEEARSVRQIISSMRSKRDRILLRRFYIDEEDKEKICSELNLSSLHFNRVLFRARRRFREMLVGYESSHNERISG